MLYEVCLELKNFFVKEIFLGKFTISNNEIQGLDDLQDGQYFRIVDSVFNDGVYKFSEGELHLIDETFTGAIWSMAVPKAVIDLAADIKAWQEKYGGVDSVNMSPYNSESFGGYSYSKSGGGSSDDGNAGTWQKAFARRLSAWRKICLY